MQEGDLQDQQFSVMDEAENTITFHMQKGNQYRVIYINGAIGGFTPEMNLHMTVYNERVPLPQLMVNHVNPDGTVGDEIRERREGKQGIIREMEGTLVMSLETAIKLHEWMERHIQAGQQQVKQQFEQILEAKKISEFSENMILPSKTESEDNYVES